MVSPLRPFLKPLVASWILYSASNVVLAAKGSGQGHVTVHGER